MTIEDVLVINVENTPRVANIRILINIFSKLIFSVHNLPPNTEQSNLRDVSSKGNSNSPNSW